MGGAAAIPAVCTTPLAMLGVPGEGEAEQMLVHLQVRSHSLKYQLCALHAVLIFRVMFHDALCCSARGVTQVLPRCSALWAVAPGSSRAGALSAILAKSNMSQSQALLRPYC